MPIKYIRNWELKSFDDITENILIKKPNIKILNGEGAELKPIILDGKIVECDVRFGGKDYTSAPDLDIVGLGTGIGGKLRAVVENGKITNPSDKIPIRPRFYRSIKLHHEIQMQSILKQLQSQIKQLVYTTKLYPF